MADAVLVIDMVRGFLEKGYPLYLGDESRRIIPQVARLLEKEVARGSRVFYLCDNHDPDDLEFRMFARHCVAGSVETEVIPELGEYPGAYVPKKRYSAFYGNDLARRLGRLKPAKLIVVGVCTNICVMHTVADARDRDYEVEVPARCVTTWDADDHKYALKHMEKVLGAKVV